jgi:hypothetical protein
MEKSIYRISAVLALFILFLNEIKAQNYLFHKSPDSTAQLDLRYYRPSFSNPITDLTFLGGIYEARLNMPLGEKYNLNVTIPFINSAFQEFDAERGIGNPSIGLQRKLKQEGKENSNIMLEIFLPIATSNSDYLDFGIFTNFHDFAKYLADAMTIHINYAHSYNVHADFYLLGEIGPSVVIDVGDSFDESEVILRYGIAAMYDFKSFNIRSEFTGEGILTENDSNDKFFQSISFGAQLTQGNFKPGIFYNVFLDDNLSTSTDGVVGLIFAFDL